jgi:hypothetical protein
MQQHDEVGQMSGNDQLPYIVVAPTQGQRTISMSLLSKELLSSISTWAEILAVVLTALGALSGVTFVVVSKPLRKIEAHEKLVLQQQVADAGLAAAQATERAKEAERSATENQKETAILTAQNLKLEAAINPRRLTAKQLKELVDIKYAGGPIEVRSYANDVEGLVVATQITDALRTRANLIDNRSTMQPVRIVLFGVTVTGTDAALVAELSAVLGNLIEKSAPIPRDIFTITTGYGMKVSRVPPAAMIQVGVKPIK